MLAAMGRERSRREFLVLATAGMGLTATRAQAAGRALALGSAPGDRTCPVPRRPLGRTGAQVSILGVGGWHLGAVHDSRDAVEIVHRAMDAGVDFFDSAWEYHEGKSEEILGRALAGRRDRAFVMTKVCTHGRKADVAMAMLEQSLRRLGTSYVDLWQIHECIYDSDPDLHFQRDGVVDALARAKQQGKRASSASPGTRIRASTSGCSRAAFRSIRCSCRSIASTPASAASSSTCCRRSSNAVWRRSE
jgi:hypothetical protein